MALISAATWLYADLSASHVYTSMTIMAWNAVVRLGYFVLHSLFLTKIIKLYEKAHRDSSTDWLTGAQNARFFYRMLEIEMSRAQRKNIPFSLAYIDLDNFKNVNDTLGHSTGDQLLKEFSEIVFQNMRTADVFARIGGDEFAILIPESTFQESDAVMARIREKSLESFKIHHWPVTLSMGVITFSSFNRNSVEMIKLTDNLMYRVKKSGKNQIIHETL